MVKFLELLGGWPLDIYFNIIEPILMAAILSILYYNVKTDKSSRKKYIVFFSIISSLNILLSFLKLSHIGIILCFIVFLVFEYMFYKRIYHAVLTSMCYMGTVILIDMISGGIVMSILGFSPEQIRNSIRPNIILYIVGSFLALMISKFISISISKIMRNKHPNIKNIKINKMIYLYGIITVLVMYLNVSIVGREMPHLSLKIISLLIIIFTLYCILGIAFAYIYHQNYLKNMELEMRAQENERLIEYANLLEKQHDNLRIFKHDYMNILATMGGYIQLKDIDKLDKYFKQKILNGGELFKEDKHLKLIKKIHSIPVRGMLYAKLIRSQKANLDIELNVLEEIPAFTINELDVCKMLGILIDNAIEATSDSQEKKLSIHISYKQKHIYISISNSFYGTIEDTNLLYNKGYSTKGLGRGLGLYTVRTLLDTQYKNIKLNTDIQENRFIQQLILPLHT